MNIKEYIVSGIIEDYCLGFLSIGEMAVVVQNAAKYVEIKMAINEYEQILKKYAEDGEPGPDDESGVIT